jgi:hypothetical protein
MRKPEIEGHPQQLREVEAFEISSPVNTIERYRSFTLRTLLLISSRWHRTSFSIPMGLFIRNRNKDWPCLFKTAMPQARSLGVRGFCNRAAHHSSFMAGFENNSYLKIHVPGVNVTIGALLQGPRKILQDLERVRAIGDGRIGSGINFSLCVSPLQPHEWVSGLFRAATGIPRPRIIPACPDK